MVAASGFTPEVHLWAVQFGKSATSNVFQQVCPLCKGQIGFCWRFPEMHAAIPVIGFGGMI